MPNLTGTIADVTGTDLSPAQIRQVFVKAPGERPSLADGGVLIVSAPVQLGSSGSLSVALEPGPAVLTVDTYAGGPDVYDLYVTADMTLLSEAIDEAAPEHERSWSESVMIQLRDEAVAAAGAAAQSASDADGSATAAGRSATAAGTARDEAVAAKLTWRGPWAAGTPYTTRDVVSYGGSSWWALRPSTGVTPVEGADWSLLASKGQTGDPGTTTWAGITDKPTTFPPSTHQHGVTDMTATGTRSASTFLRGDNTWGVPTGTTYSVPTQAEAEAGTATTGRAFSAQRVRQAADAAITAREWYGTQAQYDALPTKDANRTYNILEG